MDPACVSSACVVDKGKWPNTISVYNEHEGKINLTMSQATITCDRLSVNIDLKEKSQRKGLKENCFFRKLNNLNWSFKGLKKKIVQMWRYTVIGMKSVSSCFCLALPELHCRGIFRPEQLMSDSLHWCVKRHHVSAEWWMRWALSPFLNLTSSSTHCL